VAQARAGRLSRQVGQRFESLEAIRQAVQLANELHLPPGEYHKLRTLAITCLTLPDVRLAQEWDGPASGPGDFSFDAALSRYAVSDLQGHVHIRGLPGDRMLFPPIPGPGRTNWCKLSPDGQFVCVMSGEPGTGDWNVWDLRGPEPVRRIEESGG